MHRRTPPGSKVPSFLRLSALLLFALARVAGVASASQAAGPPPPFAVGMMSINGQMIVAWTPVAGALGYAVHWDLGAGIDPVLSPTMLVAGTACLVENLPSGAQFHVAVASVGTGGEGPLSATKTAAVAPGGPEKFFPAWADVPPSTVLEQLYNPGLSSAQNGANLKAVMLSLLPGDELRIGAGTWTIDSLLDLALAGTASAPIRITAKPGAKPVITRSDAGQNTVNVGQGSTARYLLMRGLEIRGGDIGLRIHNASQVWIDQCEVHDSANTAVAANSEPVERLYLTRNTVHGTDGYGEGIYLGGNFASAVARECVIAQNHVYDTAGSQGDGIEVKQGSWGNLIAENFVHGTHYPCILVYGTGGMPPNLIERNVLIGSGDAVLQVQGEAVVINNLLADGALGFLSTDHQGLTRDLTFAHNTIINTGTAAQMTSWNDRPGMTFANNAAYSQSGDAIQFSGGSSGVKVTGNVAYGPVTGTLGGYALGGGLGDFAAVTWDGVLNITPSEGGALDGAGDPGSALLLDVTGGVRWPGMEAGAMDAP
jgi:hypothetical protein